MQIALGIVVGVILGVIFTYLFAHRLSVLQKKRKRLGYEVLSRDIIIPFESKLGNGLQVTVKKSLIAADDKLVGGVFVPAGRVFGFRVLLRNTGNETIKEQKVLIELDDNAKVVATEIEHGPSGRNDILPGRDPDKPYVSTCYFPYINEDEEFIVSIQSVRNGSRKCKVLAHAPDLKIHDLAVRYMRQRVLSRWLSQLGFVFFTIAVVVAVAIYGWDYRISNLLKDATIGWLLLSAQFLGLAAFFVGSALTLMLIKRR